MKKKILAVALAATMVVASAFSAFAEDVTESKTYDGGLTVDGSTGWNSAGGDEYYLSDDDVTIVFENTPFQRDSDNWSNFIIETTSTSEADGITLRADAYGWTYGDGVNTPSYEVTTSWGDDWDAFVAAAPGTTTLVASKTSSSVITFSITLSDGSTEVYTVTYPDGAPDSIGFHVGADGGTVVIQSVTYGTASSSSDDDATDAASDDDATDAASDDDATDAASDDDATTTTTAASTAETGDVTTFAAIAIVVAAAAAIVVLKKRVTE